MASQTHALPISVLGAATCEDTAIVRDRLRALQVPSAYVDVDVDAAALARVERLNAGHRVTPTVIVGDERSVVAEPTLEAVERLSAEAGYAFERPVAVDLHGEVTRRPIPLRSVIAAEGGSFTLASLRGKRQVALFLAHGTECLPCFGYARQLAGQSAAMATADAAVVTVVSGTSADLGLWHEGLSPDAVLAGDPGATWKAEIADRLAVAASDAMLVVLDRFLAPRAVSTASEAGGLVGPVDATEWLRFLALECPECSGEIGWPEEA